jgi:hypothetical protein
VNTPLPLLLMLMLLLPACRGQSIKVFSQLLRKARQRGFILPFMKVGGQGAGQDGVAYEGATVLEPKIGGGTCGGCLGQLATFFVSVDLLQDSFRRQWLRLASPSNLNPRCVFMQPVLPFTAALAP